MITLHSVFFRRSLPLLMCCVPVLTPAASAAAARLELTTDDRSPLVRDAGRPLFADDRISYAAEPLRRSAGRLDRDPAGWQVLNHTADCGDWRYRRELALSPDGDRLELGVQIFQKSYTRIADNRLHYTIRLPLAEFADQPYFAVTGRSATPREETGVVDAARPNAGLPLAECRALIIGRGEEARIFDFNPEGVTSYSDWGPTLIRGQWQVRSDGRTLEFSLPQSVGIAGTLINSKLTVSSGNIAAYRKRHTQKRYHYYDDLPAARAFAFGASRPGKAYTAVNTRPFRPDQPAGWCGDTPKTAGRLAESGAMYGFVEGASPDTFRAAVEPGLYLVTVSIAAGDEPVGPFAIDGKAKDQKIAPRTVRTIVWTAWLDDRLELGFSGRWRVSAVALQRLLTPSEDYKFKRTFWRMPGLFEPGSLYHSADYRGEPEYRVAVSDLPLPPVPAVDPPAAVTRGGSERLLIDRDRPDMAWRYRSTLGSIGTFVTGSFDEFSDDAAIRRRIAELKAQQVDAITVDGLHGRLLFSGQSEKIQDVMRRIVAEAHRNGIKVIDHYSLTLLWNWGDGLRFLAEHPDWLQHSIAGNLPGRGLCPNHPEFRRYYFDRVKEFIRATDIDGLMVDEIGFQNRRSCACAVCRQAFTADTGLTLPLDECSPLLYNLNSNLYRSFLSWRTRSIGDFYVAMRREINQVKPDFTLLNYTTHRLFYERETIVNNGIDITEAARGCDYLGIEIMTRNVFASYRTVFALGKLTNSLRETYGAPIYRLVYNAGDPRMAGFSRALNAMLGQITWYLGSTPNLPHFAGGMDNFHARQQADAAVLFSTLSRDRSRFDFLASSETNGFLQLLGDGHIPSTALLEGALTAEKLAGYPLLIVPAAACLSDATVAVLLDYARNGGTLLLTTVSGSCDEAGNRRAVWPFASYFGITPDFDAFTRPGRFAAGGREAAGHDLRVLNYRGTPAPGSETLLLADGAPAGFAVRCGRGKLAYLAAELALADFEKYEQRIGQPWMRPACRDAAAVVAALLDRLLADRRSFRLESAPEPLLSSLAVENGDTHLVHLLNVSGVRFRPREIVGAEPPEPAFPALPDTVFTLRCPPPAGVALTSPDFDGAKRLPFVVLPDDRTRVTVPAGTFQTYAVIRIK